MAQVGRQSITLQARSRLIEAAIAWRQNKTPETELALSEAVDKLMALYAARSF